MGMRFIAIRDPPPSPPPCEEGGNEDRFCEGLREMFFGFHRMPHAIQSHPNSPCIRYQESPTPPFLVGKGAGGIGPY